MKSVKELLTSHEKFHITLGLERIEKILALLNHPEKDFKVIHVAGTNGKGSTCKIINEILIENFKNTDTRIGLYISPHLFKYNERIKVNNEDISDLLLNNLIYEIDELAKKNGIELSEFELLTSVAFYYFSFKKVKYAILETGLGGLYDATNVIQNPLVEVITTIDLDHTQRLGNTIDEIAFQKAGIIKENSKVVFNKDNKGYKVLNKVAKEKNAKIIETVETEVFVKNKKSYAKVCDKTYEFNLFGSHQKENLQLALGAIKSLNLKISNETYTNALKNVKWPFRLEYRMDKNILIDGGHNPSGITTLSNFLKENFKEDKKTFIFGCLKNKDYNTMLDILLNSKDKFYFYEFNYPNALKYNELSLKHQKQMIKITTIDEIKNIIEEQNNLKIFSGSLYMLGQIFTEVKL